VISEQNALSGKIIKCNSVAGLKKNVSLQEVCIRSLRTNQSINQSMYIYVPVSIINNPESVALLSPSLGSSLTSYWQSFQVQE